MAKKLICSLPAEAASATAAVVSEEPLPALHPQPQQKVLGQRRKRARGSCLYDVLKDIHDWTLSPDPL